VWLMPDESKPGEDSPANADPLSAVERERQSTDAINQRVFDTSLDLILVCDKRGNIIRVSPSSNAIIGYDPSEMIAHSAREFLYPPDLDNTRTEMRLARRGRLMRNFECRYVHKNGRVVPLIWTGVWSEPAQQHFFIGRDLSEREAVEQRLRQAQRMDAVGQLTGGLAHDFNNLLAVVIGNLDLVRSKGWLEGENDELIGEALDAAKLGAELTRRLLAFARRQQLQPRRIAVNQLVTAIAGLLGRILGEQIAMSLSLADEVWPVLIDPGQLEASLVNLATNARDAMPKGGRLTIATANRQLSADYAAANAELAPGDYVMIEISDTGGGIPPEVMTRIFEPFFTTKEPGKGTGLGLSMVFGFVKQSGGHINVYSEPGAGTTFRLYLPRDRQSTATERHQSAAAPVAGGSETILVVEDNAAIRRVVRRQLTSLGYRVVEAERAVSALELLEREKVALLFSDVVMPGEMSGVELAQKAKMRWPKLKIVLTSGFPEARLDGGGDFLAGTRLLGKPYAKEDLALLLREVLDAK
jgi:PAS domain S-box-containing protein